MTQTHSHTPGQMTNVADIQQFMVAGHATFTLVSVSTKGRYTYKIDAVPDSENRYFVSVLSGSDNESDYMYIGMMFDNDDRGFHFSPKKNMEHNGSTAAFKWFAMGLHTIEGDELPEVVEFWHEGKCAMCGKKLTTPESIERGFGPVCYTRI
jgi:hypothetical protein